MKNKYKIIVESKKIKYEFEIKRNITILKGDSATGKTTLMELVEEYYEKGNASGINIICEKECVVLAGRNWKEKLLNIKDSIVFIDEFNPFLTSEEFAKVIKKTDNYYILITRENLYNLPYSVDEIYGIRESNKYAHLNKIYNEFYNIYSENKKEICPDILITEDSNSGYEFFYNICKDKKVCSANGKTKILKKLNEELKTNKNKELLVIADGAALGSEMDKLYKMSRFRNNINLFLPESFEWVILKSGILKKIEIDKILSSPYSYIESEKYFSWERYFTDLLKKNTVNTYLNYNKKKLNTTYLQPEIIEQIKGVMKNIKI